MFPSIYHQVSLPIVSHSVIAISDSVGNTHLINTLSQAETQTCPTNSEFINAMCFSPSGSHLYTASDDQRVCSFEYPSLKFEHFIDRAQMPVKHISINKDGSLMAIASLESSIKIINIKKEPSLFSTLKGHEGGTLCVSFDPTDKLLASAGKDGSVRIWNVSNGQEVACLPDMVAKEVLRGFSDKLPMPYRLEWTFDGKYLIVPHKKVIALVDRKSFKIFKEIKEENMGIVYMVTSSPSYSNFVCCDLNKKCYFFDIDSNITSKKNSYPMKHPITSLQWSPNSDACLVGDSRGTFKLFDLNKKIPIFDQVDEDSTPIEERGPKKPIFQFDESVNGSLSSFPLSQDAFSLPASQLSQSGSSQEVKKSISKPVDKKKPLPPRFMDVIGEDIDEDEDLSHDEHETSMLEHSYPTYELQKAFQPGACAPIDRKRFLAYNEVGMIVCTEESNSNTIEIEFHDVMTYKHERFNDPAMSSMATLSQKGALFACKKKGKNASSFFFKAFNSWASDTQWKISMEEEEEIECVALCDHFVIVSTHTRDDQYLVRIYSIGGLQLYVFTYPQILSMVGFQDLLAIVYYEGNVIKVKVLNMITRKTIRHGVLPVTSKSTLKWIGFTQLGCFTFYDSSGLLCACSNDWDGEWIPILNNWEFKEEYWITRVTSDQVLYVPLDGGVSPQVVPRPPQSSTPLLIPFNSTSLLKWEQELGLRKYILSELKPDQKKQIEKTAVKIDKELISIIYETIQKNQLQRALDASSLLISDKSKQIAKRVANDHKISQLSDRMNQVMSQIKVEEGDVQVKPVVVPAVRKEKEKVDPIPIEEEKSQPEPTVPKPDHRVILTEVPMRRRRRKLVEGSDVSNESKYSMDESSQVSQGAQSEEKEVDFDQLTQGVDKKDVKKVNINPAKKATIKQQPISFKSFNPNASQADGKSLDEKLESMSQTVTNFKKIEIPKEDKKKRKKDEGEKKPRKKKKDDETIEINDDEEKPVKQAKKKEAKPKEEKEPKKTKSNVAMPSKPLIPVGVVNPKKKKEEPTVDVSQKKLTFGKLSDKLQQVIQKQEEKNKRSDDDDDEFPEIEIKK